MPIYLRLYYLKRLEKQYKDEQDSYNKQVKKSQVKKPNIKKPRVRK